jgi:hypothetical protein
MLLVTTRTLKKIRYKGESEDRIERTGKNGGWRSDPNRGVVGERVQREGGRKEEDQEGGNRREKGNLVERGSGRVEGKTTRRVGIGGRREMMATMGPGKAREVGGE